MRTSEMQISEHIGTQFTFENFNVTPQNRAAFEKAGRFAEDRRAKPLYLTGGYCMGKTHLLFAVRNEILRLRPDRRVILTDAKLLCEEMVHELTEHQSLELLYEKYRSADVLLIDDIQLLAGKEMTQKEVIRLLNALYESGRQIMLTASGSGEQLDKRLCAEGFFGEAVSVG